LVAGDDPASLGRLPIVVHRHYDIVSVADLQSRIGQRIRDSKLSQERSERAHHDLLGRADRPLHDEALD
jgi:hypothetical protein